LKQHFESVDFTFKAWQRLFGDKTTHIFQIYLFSLNVFKKYQKEPLLGSFSCYFWM